MQLDEAQADFFLAGVPEGSRDRPAREPDHGMAERERETQPLIDGGLTQQLDLDPLGFGISVGRTGDHGRVVILRRCERHSGL